MTKGQARALSELHYIVFLSILGGITIPLGGFLARIEHIQPLWLEEEFRHSVIAFGGGVLLATVALVLVPEGTRVLPAISSVLVFGIGGLIFFYVSSVIERRGGSQGQFMAMLLDFIPESLALGAMLTASPDQGLLLATLIAIQNLPEGFNAYRELVLQEPDRMREIMFAFCGIVIFGPIMAWLGYAFLRDLPEVLGGIMLFSAGGILYLTFQSIAPQAKLDKHWAPALGAVTGFMLGLWGYLLVR